MSFSTRRLISKLKRGAVIAYPTETVWGLGCLPNNQEALQKLAEIKQRSVKKGFILVSPNINFCLPYIKEAFHQQAKENITLNLEKPTTWLVPKSSTTSSLISGQFHTVAIRISPHPFITDICNQLNMPLTSTSANLHSRPSLNSAIGIQRFLGDRVKHIVHGYKSGLGQASTIIDLQSKRIIRL